MCATGISSGRAARSVATPLIQKCECTTSGRHSAPRARESGGERSDVRIDRILGDRAARAGIDVLDDQAGGHLHPHGHLRIVAPRVHDDVVAELRGLAGERGDVDVLPARVDAAERRERARVLGNHRNPHAVTSVSSASHARKNRSKP